MESSAKEAPSIGNLSLPPEMVWAALCFLDGRSLRVFETASKGTRQAVQDSPDLYKTLLLRQIDNVPHMVSLPRKEGKRALIAWEAGDFQPVPALVSRRAPCPRYLHRVAEAGDGWTYLHGGHLESGLSDDVWRFRVSESKGRQCARAKDTALKLRWEQVWGGNEEESLEDDGSDSSSDGGEDGEEQELDDDTTLPAAAVPPPNAPPTDEHHGPLPPAQMFAAALAVNDVVVPPGPAFALGAAAHPAFQAAMLAANHGVLGDGFGDAAGVDAAGVRHVDRPRPRCAASWTWEPGTNKIYLFGGQGSDGDFLGDLWCFHAGGRGECRWEKLNHVREPRPSGGGGSGEEEEEDNDHDEENEGGGAAAPWRVPEGRWGHTMVEHRGLLYMFGGSSPGKAYAGLWRLDISVSPCMWSLVTPDRGMAEAGGSGRPVARGGHSATVVRDSLYIFGGNVTQSVFKDLWVIDLPTCKAWRQVQLTPGFPPARIGHSAVAVGNRILIFGGRDFNTRIFTGGLSCFDVDLQAFVRFPHAEAFSQKSSRGGGMWDGLKMTGHAAVHCSRGLLIVGGLLPRSLTMSAWTLDVIRGCRGRERQRRRRSGSVLDKAAEGCAPS